METLNRTVQEIAGSNFYAVLTVNTAGARFAINRHAK